MSREKLQKASSDHPVWCAAIYLAVIMVLFEGAGIFVSGGFQEGLYRVILAVLMAAVYVKWFGWSLETVGITWKHLGKTLLLGWPELLLFLCFAPLILYLILQGGDAISAQDLSQSAFLQNLSSLTMSSFLSSMLFAAAVGSFEEMLFRAGLINILMQRWHVTHLDYLKVAAVDGLLFGLIHSLNFFSGPMTADHTFYTLVQVLQNIGCGMFWAAIYLRTRNIVGMTLIHAMSDGIIFCISGGVSVTNITPDFTGAMLIGLMMVGLAVFYLRKMGSRSSGKA